MPCTYHLLYQCSNRPKRCVVDFFLNLDMPQARLCINFLSLSLTWGLLSNIFVLFDLFSPACGLLSEFWEYFSSLFAFFFGTFCRFLTFGATFLYLKSIFLWNGYKKEKRNAKNAEKSKQLSRPGLYKRILFVQERPNIQQVRIRLLGLWFVFTCYCLDTWQAWPNATKRHQKEMTFADADCGNPRSGNGPVKCSA